MTVVVRSIRRQIAEALMEEWGKVRNERYFVQRGAISWAGHSFEDHPFAVAVTIAEFPMFAQNGDGVLSFEIFTLAPNFRASRPDIEDASLDDLFDDVCEVITKLKERARDGDSSEKLVLKVDPRTRALEASDVERLGTQGIVVNIPIEF